MKKILFTIAIICLTVVAVMAQPRAIGARAGYNFELSYQHETASGMFEVDAGVTPFLTYNAYYSNGVGDDYWDLFHYGRVQAMVLYDYIVNPAANFNIYFGAGLGVSWGYGDLFDITFTNSNQQIRRLGLPVAAQIGLEYELPIPLNLSVDWRPSVNLFSLRESLGSKLLNVALGIRYRF